MNGIEVSSGGLVKVAYFAVVLCLILILGFREISVYGWSNGGFSDDPSSPDYGTHDWIAQHALDWLPNEGKTFILDNLAVYLYGTELPDNGYAPDGVGDTSKHHVYFLANGSLQDDASAVRAQQEFENAVSLYLSGQVVEAVKRLGMMTHYVSDIAVFGHVMGSLTDWGKETHHSDYEAYVNERTNSYDDEFNVYLSFDGALEHVLAYNATLQLGYDTTFDIDGELTCVWMDTNYDWSNPTFRNRCGESLNLAVNLVADVLHAFYVEVSQPRSGGLTIVINEVELNPSGTDTGNEWVELFNPTDETVDLSGWKLTTTAGEIVTVTIPMGTSILSYDYWIYTHTAQWLDNSGESVILYDSLSGEIDRTSLLSDDSNDNRVWARFPNGYDTNSTSDWRFQSSTKGENNGRASSSITCTVNPQSVDLGENVEITGQILPAHSYVAVNLTLTAPNVSATTRTIATNDSGFYNEIYTPYQIGLWKVSASWQGDYDHQPASSLCSTFNVSAGVVHDLALINVTLSSDQVYVGQNVTITVHFKNEGTENEASFGLEVYADSVFDNGIWFLGVVFDPGEIWSWDFVWNTAGVSAGNYTIAAELELGYPEEDTADNVAITHVYVNSDDYPPRIETPVQYPEPDYVQPYQNVTVLVNATDYESGVKNVTLLYGINNSDWISKPMKFNSTSNMYEATVSGYPPGTQIKYSIVAYDNAGNSRAEDNAGTYYIYTVVPEFPSALIIIMFTLLCTVATILMKKVTSGRTVK